MFPVLVNIALTLLKRSKVSDSGTSFWLGFFSTSTWVEFPCYFFTPRHSWCTAYETALSFYFPFDPLRHRGHLVILSSSHAHAPQSSLLIPRAAVFLPASAKICWSRYQRHKRPAMPSTFFFFFLTFLLDLHQFFSSSQVFKCFEVCLTDCCNDFWEDRMRLARA